MNEYTLENLDDFHLKISDPDNEITDLFIHRTLSNVEKIRNTLNLATCKICRVEFEDFYPGYFPLPQKVVILVFRNLYLDDVDDFTEFLNENSANVWVKAVQKTYQGWPSRPKKFENYDKLKFFLYNDQKPRKLNLSGFESMFAAPIDHYLLPAINAYNWRFFHKTTEVLNKENAAFFCGSKLISYDHIYNDSFIEYMSNGTITNVTIGSEQFMPALISALENPNNKIKKLQLLSAKPGVRGYAPLELPCNVYTQENCKVEHFVMSHAPSPVFSEDIANGLIRFTTLEYIQSDVEPLLAILANPKCKVRKFICTPGGNLNHDRFFEILMKSNVTNLEVYASRGSVFGLPDRHIQKERVDKFNKSKQIQGGILALVSYKPRRGLFMPRDMLKLVVEKLSEK